MSGLMFARTRSLTFDEGRVRGKGKQCDSVIAASSHLDAWLCIRHLDRRGEERTNLKLAMAGQDTEKEQDVEVGSRW